MGTLSPVPLDALGRIRSGKGSQYTSGEGIVICISVILVFCVVLILLSFSQVKVTMARQFTGESEGLPLGLVD